MTKATIKLTGSLASLLIVASFGTSSSLAQPWPLGNQLNTHANWDTGTADWDVGNSKTYTEGEVVPHIVKFTPDSVAQFFLDICLEALTGGVYGYVNPLAAYNTTYSPTTDLDGGPINITSTMGAVGGTNATIVSVSSPGVLNAFDCDGTGEIGWEVVFTSDVADSTGFLYFGGTLGKPGDTGVDSGTLDETNSPSNKNGVWQSRVESGGDKTTQITSPEPALPVELVSFDARLDGSDAILTWETASETNNSGFAIEHSDNGGPFEEVDFVPGAGNSLEINSYTYTVNDVSVGLHRFRLKQIDFDGAFTYSAVVEVTSEVPGTHLLSEAYPNPFNPTASFSLAVSSRQEVSIDVYDMLGRHVSSLFRGTLEANVARTFAVNAADWTSGSYTVVVEGENFRDNRNLVLLK